MDVRGERKQCAKRVFFELIVCFTTTASNPPSAYRAVGPDDNNGRRRGDNTPSPRAELTTTLRWPHSMNMIAGERYHVVETFQFLKQERKGEDRSKMEE